MVSSLSAWCKAQGFSESESSIIVVADSLGYDMIQIHNMIKGLGKEHEASTRFTLPNIAFNLL